MKTDTTRDQQPGKALQNTRIQINITAIVFLRVNYELEFFLFIIAHVNINIHKTYDISHAILLFQP